MFHLKWIAPRAVVAAIALYAVSAAAQTPVGEKNVLSPYEGPYGAQPAARRPLMDLLERGGLSGPLDEARINLYGRAEGSYTYNFDNPAQDLNLGRVFDIEHDQFLLNQLDLNFERVVDPKIHQFDVGFRLEMLYGGDARFIHSNGLLDTDDFFNGPENQFDVPQLYVDVAIPVGNGLRVRAGKFLFFKQIDPNASVFYSHSFTFGGALPFTLTGVTGWYPLNDQWSVEAGISRGWGQSLEDNNDAIDALGRVRYDMSDRTSFSLAAITGPEQDDDNSHYRTVFDATVNHACTDNLTLLLDVVYGYQGGVPGGDEAHWYGVAGYGVYRVNHQVSVGGRLEWYRDEEGYTTQLAQNLYEATLGLTLTPFPSDRLGSNFKVRPEIRYDYSSRAFFDGLSRHDQFTAAVDAIFNF